MPSDENKPAEGGSGDVAEVVTEAAAAEAPEAPPDPLAEAEARATKAEAERKETHDRMLRVAADFENYKRRARKDAEEAESRGRKSLAMAMLPTVDNLERALDASGGDSASTAIAEGVRLVLKQMVGALEKFDVKPFAATGQPFDPSVHEAIQQIETADQPAGTVVKELQKGYLAGGKLLRPAMVAVAKAPAVAEPPAGADKADEIAVEVDTGDGANGPNGGAPPEAS